MRGQVGQKHRRAHVFVQAGNIPADVMASDSFRQKAHIRDADTVLVYLLHVRLGIQVGLRLVTIIATCAATLSSFIYCTSTVVYWHLVCVAESIQLPLIPYCNIISGSSSHPRQVQPGK